MRLLQPRTYAGQPHESVTVDTEVEGGGRITVLVDGVDVGEDPVFQLKSNPGDETQVRIALFGAVGESCVVQIREVNGGSDGDLLLCQISDPAPVHFYRFIVTAPRAIAALERVAASPQPGIERAAPAAPRRTGSTPGGRKRR